MNGTDLYNNQYEYLKGATYQLSPLTIFLSVFVILHNLMIFLEYFRDKTSVISSFFMGIALADIFTAVGQLVVSVISILVYTNLVDPQVLYKSFYFFIFIALPGYSCSKFLSTFLAIIQTSILINPFRRLRREFLKSAMIVMILILTALHWSDGISALVADVMFQASKTKPSFYVTVLMFCESPGTLAILLTGYCFNPGKVTKTCDFSLNPLNHFIGGGVLIVVGFILPPVIVLITMVIQVVTLQRNSTKSSDSAGGHADPPDYSRHVSLTILLVSVLFFCCHTIFLISLVAWFVIFGSLRGNDSKHSFKTQGTWFGLFVMVFPLIYAVLYPVILIFRKAELRQRYKKLLTSGLHHRFCAGGRDEIHCHIETNSTDLPSGPSTGV